MVELIGIEPTISVLSFYKKNPSVSRDQIEREVYYTQSIFNINFLGSQSYLRRGHKKIPLTKYRGNEE
jgi:hypothetical protein